MAIEYANIFHSKALPRYSQIGILGMHLYHLATLVYSVGAKGFFPSAVFPLLLL
jgi:hypothetical protein